MAKRLDDEDRPAQDRSPGDRRPEDRPAEDRRLEDRHPEVEAAEFEELAYRRTKLLFDRKVALAEVHPSASRLELDTAPEVAPLELHPGARRYYDEQART